jgi:hemerythrin-like domain-containing protein
MATRSNAKTRILADLKDDHKRVRKAFRDFEKFDPKEDPEICQAIVEKTCAELEVHADLEEQVFYPAARQATKDEELLEEAEVEHTTAKTLIEQLKGMGPSDAKFGATFKVLGEYIKHHAGEEEKEMFPSLTRTSVDWDSVLERMTSRREELKEEKGLAAIEEKEALEGDPASTRRSSARSRQGPSEARPQAASGKGGKRGEK